MHLNVCQFQQTAYVAQKRYPFQSRFDQANLYFRAGSFTDQTGKSSTGANIKQAVIRLLEQAKKGQRVEEMLFDDLLVLGIFGDQVHLPGPALQLRKIIINTLTLLLIHPNGQ